MALEAGAGTGKTRALIRRLATWLLGPGWDEAERSLAVTAPAGRRASDDEVAARVADGVVAITFTEAAAAEMAQRLGSLLVAVAAGHEARDLDPAPALLAEVDRRRRSRALAASLSRLRVQTIHAFCHALLSAHPFEAGIHPALEVDADGAALAEAAREALLGRIRAAEPALLELIAQGADPLSIHESLLALLGGGARAADLDAPRFSPELCRALIDELEERITAVLPGIAALAARAKRSKRVARAAEALSDLLATELESGGADESATDDPLERLTAVCSRIAGELDEYKALAAWSQDDLNDTERKALGADVESFLAVAKPVADLVLRLAELDPRGFEIARRALAPLLAETRLRMERAGAIGFDDLLSGAANLLGSNRWVRRRVRREIRQILVDEFQDTDRRQCALLAELALVEEPDSPRPGLFVVGDPKQSIYAWRSADLVAYESFLAAMAGAGGVTGRLAMNFRSAPAILDEVERSVSPAMQPLAGLQPPFERLIPRHGSEGDRGFERDGRSAVEFWLTSDEEARRRNKAPGFRRAAEIEAAAIAADIAALARAGSVAWGEFAILLRARGDLEIYLDALRRAGVRYAVQKDRSFYRRREVIDFVSLVRAILDPADRLALVGALRSPLVGVPDAAWIPLWQAGFPDAISRLSGPDPERLAAIGALLDRAAAAVPREIPGLTPLAGWPAAALRAVSSIAQSRADWNVLPVALWLERLRARFLPEPIAAARFLGRFGLANLERLFAELEGDLAEAVDPLAALTRIRRAVESDLEAEEARPPDTGADAVSVMTIHTAKGLEFDQIYLPQIHRRPPGAMKLPENAFVAAGRSPTRAVEAVLLGAPSPGYRDVLGAAARARDAEGVRLLYVALTRARKRLVVCGIWPREARGTTAGSTFVDFLAPRRPETLDALFADPPGVVDDPARWRRIEGATPLEGAAEDRARAATEPLGLSVSAAMREAARLRQSKPLFAPASGLSGPSAPADSPADATLEPPFDRLTGEREQARARGLALHRALELAPLHERSAAAWRERALAAYRAASRTPNAAAEEAIAEELAHLPGSRLWRSLIALGPHALGRELPLVIAADAGAGLAARDEAEAYAPIAGYVGTLDLLYRDPGTGATVVADFKSDPFAGDPGPDLEVWISERLERYRPQLELYGRAFQQALALPAPPRLELWLLAVDRIVAVEPAAGSFAPGLR